MIYFPFRMSERRSLNRGFSGRNERERGNERLERSKALKLQYNLKPLNDFNGENEGYARGIIKEFWRMPLNTIANINGLRPTFIIVDFQNKFRGQFDVCPTVICKLLNVDPAFAVRFNLKNFH